MSASGSREVYCTTGGNTLEPIANSKAGIGLNPHFRKSKKGHPVTFVDYPFNQDWNGGESEYLEIVRKHRPEVVVAPDVMGGGGLSDRFLAFADRLNRYADHVVVVPKSVHPEFVPRRFRLGIPCANGWGTSTWAWGEYEREGGDGAHLLGGTPNTHLEILRDTEVDVRSVDTSAFMKGCYYNVWDGKWTERDEYGVDYYEAIRMSLNNLHHAINRFKL